MMNTDRAIRVGGVGMRLVMALSEQIDAKVQANPTRVGTEFVIELPLEPA